MPYTETPKGFVDRDGVPPEGADDVEHWTSWMGAQAEGLPEINGVFKGGGPKGAAYAGALRELEGKVAYKAVAGASAGAITAALVAAGYSAQTLEERTSALDFGTLLDERDWRTDPAVKMAFWDYKLRESPDLVTQIIYNDSKLRNMVYVAAESRKLWRGKTWARYAIETGYWLVGAGDDLGLSTASFFLGDTAIGLLMRLLRSNAQSLPEAISSKLREQDDALRILLGVYYLGGAFKGDVARGLMEKWLQQAIRGKYDPRAKPVTFREMPIPLHIVATDLTNQRLLNFPHDLGQKPYYYADPLGFPVAEAVRASMSIPLCFEPVVLNYERGTAETGTHAILVDGGVLSNYPVHAFMQDPERTVGFWLGDNLEGVVPNVTSTIAGYTGGMVGAMQEAHDRTMLALMGQRLVSAEIALAIPLTEDERRRREKEIATLTKQVAKADEEDRAVLQWTLQSRQEQLERELKDGRLCGTLDFALTKAQKDALIENGRVAGQEALMALGLVARPVAVGASAKGRED
ncbi:MAG TPA: patatin-like phospholipase family protein [Candidatus Dormibacteraeota bacterium]|nr:patatin-like phospholipase family protein [Candidatus Dormibacteraeota bacterium]